MQYYGTLGPACRSAAVLKNMFDAGMTGIRLNLSHGDLESSEGWMKELQEASAMSGVSPELLIDLRGPELRTGGVGREWIANPGDEVLFGEGGVEVLPAFCEAAERGDHFLLDDGKMEFCIVSRSSRGFLARVIRGGMIKPGKSLALLGKELPLPTLAQSDYKNIRLAKQYHVTGVMLPFVRGKEDLLTLRQALEDAGAKKIQIYAKIENLSGVRALDELFPYADQFVIARGDLGNSMPLWELPRVQKEISKKCRDEGKPFMVVTQMLDSMQERAVPTRAEVSDIYNAALDGASSLMLTGETAVGNFPAEAMRYLVRTAEEAMKHGVRVSSFPASSGRS